MIWQIDPDGARPAGANGLDARMRASLWAVALIGAAMTVGALLVLGPHEAISAGIGAMIAVGNLWVLARIVSALLPPEGKNGPPRGGPGAWALVAALKMLGLFGLVGFLMRRELVSPLPMLVGFGALPIGIAIASIVSDTKAASDT
jgi:ATP synthase I chain